MRLLSRFTLLIFLLLSPHLFAQRAIWTKEEANAWYDRQPWLVGCNYLPYNAINQLEMWQAETFDPTTIDRELALAEGLGFNTLRVYLHDQLWSADAEGFKGRIDQFLSICARHNIRPLFVLFDSCWDPFPHLGQQHDPVQGLHNSGWVQNPGADVLKNPDRYPPLEAYVKGLIGHFKDDPRILAWDVWNEPDNTNDNSYGKFEPANKVQLITNLLPQVFAWARSANPSQPLTCGVWAGDWSSPEKWKPIEKIQLENSDVISFHNYENPQEFGKRVAWLRPYGRPLLCTEYMSRGNGSTFQGTLPIAKQHKVAAFNWGFVAGKSNTIYPWDSWQKPYPEEPRLWFHDIFQPDGQPYRPEEVTFIREITRSSQPATPAKPTRKKPKAAAAQ